jgi:5-formyltetrahydrofolate cyclo-ligase
VEGKAALRAQMRAVCAEIPAEEAARQAEAVAGRVRAWTIYRDARTVMLYIALPDELDTAALLDAVLADGKRLLLPRCGPGGALEAVEVSGATAVPSADCLNSGGALEAVDAPAWRRLAPGAFGIPEPAAGRPAVAAAEIDLLLMPGRAFDLRGRRLGRGKGFFDRYLAGVGGVTAGLAFTEQILPEVPVEAHDAAVDYWITERGVTRALGGE